MEIMPEPEFGNGMFWGMTCGLEFEVVKNQLAFSFLLNTDGISPMNKSKLTIWPVFLVINELPIESRYCIDNIIPNGDGRGESQRI